MNNSNRYPLNRLIIFSRYPAPGKTKTRLVPALGNAGAADLQRKLTEKIFRTAQEIFSPGNVGVEIRFTGGNKRQMGQWLGSGALFLNQSEGNLGHRMRRAFEKAFHQGCRSVVLVGSDIPAITPDHIERAFSALNEHDLVLGPGTDGGYWLIGMNGPYDIFRGIDWGTRSVFEQTMESVKRIGMKTALLDRLNDIDTIDDLTQWQPHEAERKPYVSVIIPSFNESENIESAILSARDEDAEIIVVDGGSSDHTREKALAAGARVEKSPRGRAVQQNFGAGCAQGKTLLFLHADTVLPGGYVNRIFEAFMNPEIVAGAFRFKTDDLKPAMRMVEYMTNLRSRHLGLPYGDQGLFVRKSIFNDMGGFPIVPVAEDLLFVKRVAAKGRIRIIPDEIITSARRWQRLGIFRVTLINQLIAMGCFMGIPPRFLAPLYQRDKLDVNGRNSESRR